MKCSTTLLTAALFCTLSGFGQTAYQEHKTTVDNIDIKVEKIDKGSYTLQSDTTNQDNPAKKLVDRTISTTHIKSNELKKYSTSRNLKFVNGEGKEMTGSAYVTYYFESNKLIMVEETGHGSDGMSYTSKWYFDNDTLIFYRTRQNNPEGRGKYLVKNANAVVTKLKENRTIK